MIAKNFSLTLFLLMVVMLPGCNLSINAAVADFFAVPNSGWDLYYRPEFISLSTGTITSYLWDFGDDSTSTDPAPNHKYARSGVYTITLTVSGPGGSNTLKKENYIAVKDFADYPFPTYIIEEPIMAAWDSVMDAIQASQLDGPNPEDPVWWDNASEIKHGGGGRVLFGFSDDTIFVNHHRDFFGDNLIIDGEDKNVHFYYNGPNPCDQTEGQDALLRMHGNDNIFRNVNFDRFPEGVHIRGGLRGLIEKVTVNIICEDAMTMNGGGNKVIDAIIRDCSYQWSGDKTIMVNDGLGAMVINGCYSFDGNQPIRMTGRGVLTVRNCEFAGSRNNGPRFGGKENLVIFENNYSHNTKSGLRLSDRVSAIIRNNKIENCTAYGIRTQSASAILARIENNTIMSNVEGVYLMDNNVQMDLGGGLLDIHGYGLFLGPGITPASSTGGNILTENSPFDLNNNSSRTVMAENNIWDHLTVAEVLANDVNGAADVEPLAGVTAIKKTISDEVPKEYYLFQNYPNPFNASTTLCYWLPQESHLILEIFDIHGQRLRILIDKKQPRGFGEVCWDGKDETGSLLTSGIYCIKLTFRPENSANKQISITKKALMVK